MSTAFLPLEEHDYHPRLAAAEGLALVLFSSATCGTCRQVERLLPSAIPSGASLFLVDARKCLALARAFEVFHLPTLFLYRDGHYHARLECQITPAALAEAIAVALAGPAEEEP